jgi:hypothetical protein
MRICALWLTFIGYLSYGRAAAAGVTFEHLTDRIEVRMDGKSLTAFHHDAKWDKPFLYPIRTVSGMVISRGWPVEPRPGEEQDHPWHRGIWWGHGDINGEDFWREKPDKSTSRLALDGKPITGSDSLEVKLAMITPKATRIGTATQRYTFRRDGSNLLIDAWITIGADAGEALRFGDTEDGGFGFRLADEFRQDRGARLTNSEGLSGTEHIWGKRAKWVHYSAIVQGKPAGIAILDHPSNLRHPSGWHARGYGLNAANPFASFTNDKKNDGSYTLTARRQVRFRYLVVVHEGDLTRDQVEQYFTSFAAGRKSK